MCQAQAGTAGGLLACSLTRTLTVSPCQLHTCIWRLAVKGREPWLRGQPARTGCELEEFPGSAVHGILMEPGAASYLPIVHGCT